MNILLLTPQPPFPAHQGTAIRNWGVLRHIGSKHSITLLSFAPPDVSVAPPELAAHCCAVELVPFPVRRTAARLRTVATRRADLAERLWSPAFDRTLRRLLEASRFDLVQVEGLELGRYLWTIHECGPNTPIVYDAHNSEVTIQQRAWQSDRAQPRRWAAAGYSRLQVARLTQFEAEVCRLASAVTCVSEVDAAALRRLVPGIEPVVVPNGIEMTEYPWPGTRQPAEDILTFTGKMDYRPNVDAALWFAGEILPRIRDRRRTVRFEVIGQKPAPSLVRLDGQDGVVVVGAVPDTRPYIARGAVYVAPLRMGGGTRFKLLEAMALGRPVVSTALGAEGFSVRPEQEVLIANTAADFARAVLRLLDQPALAQQLGLAGRAFVKAGYDWSAIIPRLEAVYRRLVSADTRLS
jgi:polysaccharide biosynthesis protein PslH